MDLRSQADRALLARVIEKTRPDLIAIGPLYKMSLGRAGDTYEVAAADLASAIDHLRERYGVAFWIEHHMPKAETPGQRRGPIGSSLWQRWPEFGLELRPDPDGEGNVFNLDRFRGDRDERFWPDQLVKGVSKWPWTSSYDDAEMEQDLYDVIDGDYADFLADERRRRDASYTAPPADSQGPTPSGSSHPSANLLGQADPLPEPPDGDTR